jgi:hypothetical protein
MTKMTKKAQFLQKVVKYIFELYRKAFKFQLDFMTKSRLSGFEE